MNMLGDMRGHPIRFGSVCLAVLCLLSACGSSSPADVPQTVLDCGANDAPETGLQGQVPREDRLSGRSAQGYRCNLESIGQYQGEGTSWVSPSLAHCAYLPTSFLGLLRKQSPGVQVVDVTDPTRPVLSTNLVSPAMLIGPWESLKVNAERQLLGAVAVGPAVGVGFFDVYDIGDDCARPVHLNGLGDTALQLPNNLLGHEGNWSPDGRTYWSSGAVAGSLTAIDVTEPARPRILWTGLSGFPVNHGVEFSDDGTRLYLATGFPGGIVILDVSDIQNRRPAPMIRQVARMAWNLTSVAQHALPVSFDGRPHLIVPDEFAAEGVRIIDITDEADPQVVSQLQLEIQRPEHRAVRAADAAGNGLFGYEAHYCDVDRRRDPTALACAFFQSGVRVFDIRRPERPREIAYFNPPAQSAARSRLAGSEHASGLGLAPTATDTDPGALVMSVGNYVLNLGQLSDANLATDWCTSPPRFVGDQIWVACQDNGFMVLRFTNGAYPLP